MKRPDGVGVTRRIAFSQCLITAICAAGFGVALNVTAAYSAAIGGLISLAGNLALAWWVFGRAASPERMVRNLFAGEFVKIALTAALFVLVLTTFVVAYLPLFITYAATLFAFWIALLRVMD